MKAFTAQQRCFACVDGHQRTKELARPYQPPSIGRAPPNPYASHLPEGPPPSHSRVQLLAQNFSSVRPALV